MGRIVVVTGPQASGKSTVADLLARRSERGVHVRGDVFRRFVVSGRAAYDGELDEEAQRQWRLRHRIAADVASTYAGAGFDVVVQDLYFVDALQPFLDRLRADEVHLVVLLADAATLAARDAARAKTAYAGGLTPADHRDDFVHRTPRLGLWLDTTGLTAEATVEQVVAGLPRARLR